ncbi:10618_t:CDS:2 [Funneliformis caledonium]|uniref:cytochrome-b5 reductase n=1 Tax=Funneliformis caledonium TaxID=1117310 RepID=A0A9N8VZL8_9GLOM|nr:10618_t:CDS:2 [Funneliformis caledonium]
MIRTLFQRRATDLTNKRSLFSIKNFIITGIFGGIGYTIYKRYSDDSKKTFSPNRFLPLTVSEITPVNHNTRIFRLKFPRALKEPIPIASCVQVKDDSTQIMREYTPISPINELNFIDLLVKRYDNGHMSRLIHNLKIGDKFEVRGPVVTLPYTPNMKKHIGMITFFLFLDDILLYNDFKELSKNHPNQLKIYYTLDKPPKDNWTQGVGYVSEEMVKENIPAPNEDVLVLVCGPSSGGKASDMSQGLVRGILKKLGYTQDQRNLPEINYLCYS